MPRSDGRNGDVVYAQRSCALPQFGSQVNPTIDSRYKNRLKNCISCPQNLITLKKIIKFGIFYIFNFGFGPLYD